MKSLVLPAALLLLTGSARAGDSEAPALEEMLEAFNTHAVFPLPGLSASQLETLREGEVLRILEPSTGPDRPRRAIGLLVTERSPEALWVAAQDLHYTANDDLTEARLSLDPDTGRASWYGLLDLPTPFQDRHWVVDVWNNHALAAATGDRAWEHAWRLNPGGLELAMPLVEQGRVGHIGLAQAQQALWTPVNEGAWIVIDLPGEQALLGYHASTVVGGNIPDSVVARFAHMTLGGMLRKIEARAGGPIQAHYRAGHEPLPAGGPGFVAPFKD